MSKKFATALAGLAMALTMYSSGSAVVYGSGASVSFGHVISEAAAITPLSMQYFCAQNRSECASSGPDQITMTSDLMGVLQQVNVHVNNAIRPERDTADIWELDPTSGDCEDYVLSKRSALIRHGVAAGALRIAYTHTRSGEPHAVLVVLTSEGSYVLDNLTDTIKTVRASGYIIRTMSTANPNSWTAG